MKTRSLPILLLAATNLVIAPAGFARAPLAPHAHAPAHPVLSESLRLVFENYLKIQTALAQDSLQGVPESATALAKAVRTEPQRTLPRRVADQAERLARSKSLTEARDGFLRLTPPLAAYARENRPVGFYEGYCRMHRAYWLQAGRAVHNPNMGEAVPGCGRLRDMNRHWI